MRIVSRPQGVTGPGPSAPGAHLRDAIQQLAAQRPTREEFAAQAVKLIGEAANTRAVVLLRYEQRHEKLRLLAADGVEEEALAGLSGGKTGWDVPLRALRNRRINVIESAQTNPFVPPSIIALSPRQLTIATVPFYHGNLPIGVAVLISPLYRGFSDALLQNLSQALRVCATALVDLPSAAAPPDAPRLAIAPRERAPGEARPVARREETPAVLQGVTTLKSEVARLTRALEEAERLRAAEAAERVTAETFLQAQREHVSALEKALESLRQENERLMAAREQAQQLDAKLREVVTDREAARLELARLQQELVATTEKLAAAEQAWKDEMATLESVSAARDDLQHQLDDLRDRMRDRERTQGELERQILELEARADLIPDLEQKLADGEANRTRLELELAALREELAAARGGYEKADVALRQLNERAAAAQAQADELRQKLAAAERRIEELRGTERALAAATARVEALEGEQRALQKQLEEVRTARETESAEIESTLREWTDRLQRNEAERLRLEEDLARARAHSAEIQAELNARIEAAERDRKQLAERLGSIGQADAERTRLAARVEELEGELGSLRSLAEAQATRLQEVNDANSRLIAERRELHARIESLTRGGATIELEKQAAINAAQQRVTELESALARMARTLNATRAQAEEELTRVRTELADASAAQGTLQRDLSLARQEVEHHKGEIGELVAERERLRATVEHLQQELNDFTQRMDATTTQMQQLYEAREEAVRRIAGLEAERKELQAARELLEREIGETRQRLSSEAAGRLAEVEAALAGEREARRNETNRFARELARVREEMTAQLQEMTARHEAAEKKHLLEIERISRELAEREQILHTVEERLGADATLGKPAAAEAGGEGAEEPMLAIDRSGGEAEEITVATEVYIIDAPDRAATVVEKLRDLGHQVCALAPEAGALSRVDGRRIACAAVNLAFPASWMLLRDLRRDRKTSIPLVAYALGPDAGAGFWFGPVDFALLPVTETVTELLQRMLPKVRRVIAMSNDIDVMGGVRTQLSKSRISTAVVLDGRQVIDMVPSVRPEAAVLHLSPVCNDVFRAIAGLRAHEVSRDIPILFLLDDKPQPREEAFATSGVRMLTGRGNLKAADLVGALAETLAPFR